MNATALIRMAAELADHATMSLIEDMRDAPMTRPTPNGGNHPLWVLGHLVFAEGFARQTILGGEHPAAEWVPLFIFGSAPSDDPSVYPSFDELLAKYRELHGANMRLLDELGEDGLDEPITSAPPGFEEIFKTPAHVLLVGALHKMNHRGQVADARRALGRAPVFEPDEGAEA